MSNSPSQPTPKLERTGDWVAGSVFEDHTAISLGERRSALLSVTSVGKEADEAKAVEPSADSFPRAFGNYELLAEIARGGMGIVYRARQKSLGRIVAIKTILPSHVASPGAVQRFYQEAQAAAALDHPGIVGIFEINEHQGEHYFAMAFVEGMSLSTRVKKNGPLPPIEAARLVQSIAEAVHYANARGILHRDLKPDNILLDTNGRARVTDFGLAKQLDSGEQGLTVTGQIMGTPAYMSPEQALGGKRSIGPQSDLYAVGGILYFVLTGKAPFQGDTITELLCKVVQDRPASLREFAPNMPSALEIICMTCLEKNPQDRYTDCAQLAAALADFSQQAPATHRPNVTPPPSVALTKTFDAVPAPLAARPARKGSPLLVAGVALAILVGIGGVLAYRFATAPKDDSIAQKPEEKPVLPLVLPKDSDKEVPIPGLLPAARHEPAEPRRVDFGLQVDLIGVNAPTKGVYRMKDGETLRVRIRTTKNAFIGVWTVDPEGNMIQLFPYVGETDNFVRADTPTIVPGKVEFEAVASTGIEQIHVVASTKKWTLAKGKQEGLFQVFRGPSDRNEWKQGLRTMRTIRIKPEAKQPDAPEISEKVLPYYVSAAANPKP